MEFVGPGVASMDTDYRNGVDVMTTEIYTVSYTLSLHDALPISARTVSALKVRSTFASMN